MIELLTKAWGRALGGARKGTRAIATGNTQQALGMQSPQLATGAVRLGRFFYMSLLGWVGVSWYTGFVNERTETGSGPQLLIDPTKPIINAPDRPDKSLGDIIAGLVSNASDTGGGGGPRAQNAAFITQSPTSNPQIAGRTLVALLPSQLGVGGTAMGGYLWSAPSGQKQLPPYNAVRTNHLSGMATKIASRFHLRISSGYRPGSQGAGGPDLHSVGLAFDMVGRVADMKAAAVWASRNPHLFQEIFVHNEGSGLHLHLGMYPDAYEIINKGVGRYNRASTGPSGSQVASPLTPQLT